MGGFNDSWGLGHCLVLRKSSINVSNNCKVVICEGQVELMETTKSTSNIYIHTCIHIYVYILHVKDCKNK